MNVLEFCNCILDISKLGQIGIIKMLVGSIAVQTHDITL